MWRRGPVFLQFFHSTCPSSTFVSLFLSFYFSLSQQASYPFLDFPLSRQRPCVTLLELYDLSLIRHCRVCWLYRLECRSRRPSPTKLTIHSSFDVSRFLLGDLATITRNKKKKDLFLPSTSTPLVFLLFFDQKHYFSNACLYDVASLCKVYDIHTVPVLYKMGYIYIYIYIHTRMLYIYIFRRYKYEKNM